MGYEHTHKYGPYTIKADFEPMYFSLPHTASDEIHQFIDTLPATVYRRVEYAIMTCLCGDAIKKKIRQDGEI